MYNIDLINFLMMLRKKDSEKRVRKASPEKISYERSGRTMENGYKKVCYDDNPHYRLHYTVEEHPQNSTPPHLHYDTSLVLTYFIKGTGNIRVEGQLYPIEAGDLILLNPNEIHLCTVDNCSHERLALYISDSILDSFHCEEHTFFNVFYKRASGTHNVIPANVVHALKIDEQLMKILRLNQEYSVENSVLAICAIIELLSMLNRASETDTSNNITAPVSNKQITAIIKYLSENYDKKISIDALAKQFHFSKHYLCRMFKEYTGTTIGEYCTFKKLMAFNQLICQGQSLEGACYQVGFQNYSNFFRLYKKHMGITPSEYKRSISQK